MRLPLFVLFLASALVSDSWAVPGLSYKCRDSYFHPTCRYFLGYGMCHTEEAIKYCPLTCNACDKQCIDKPGLDCQSLKKEGLCAIDEIRDKCQISCGICCRDMASWKYCGTSKAKGSCSKKEMQRCAKSCGLCTPPVEPKFSTPQPQLKKVSA